MPHTQHQPTAWIMTGIIAAWVAAWVMASFASAAPVTSKSSPMLASKQVTIRIGSEPRQQFLGFGFSLTSRMKHYREDFPPKLRQEVLKLTVDDLHATIVRLWLGTEDAPDVMLKNFMAAYVDSGVIHDLQAHGIKTLLLAPARSHRPADLHAYANKLAQFIATLRTHGVTINVTGVTNEPKGWSPQQVVEAVKELRAALDKRRLESVSIIAPEVASVDHVAYADVEALKKDPQAWGDLLGIATHSYNMAASPRIADMVLGTGKQYWMTEAGDTGIEMPDNALHASGAAGRLINDLNNGVTHWIWFIGFQGHDPGRDGATKLIRTSIDHPDQLIILTKYYTLKQVLQAFDYGAIMRPLTIDGKTPYWTYGRKPPILAAAGRNPDGTWAIGIVNHTSNLDTHSKISSLTPAATYAITLDAGPLTDVGPVTFEVHRSNGELHIEDEGGIIMTHGRLRLTLEPHDVVTLRSVKPIEPRSFKNHEGTKTRRR